MRNKISFLSTDFQLEKVCSFISSYDQVSPYAKGCSIFNLATITLVNAYINLLVFTRIAGTS